MSGKWWIPWAFVAMGCASGSVPNQTDSASVTRIAGRLHPEVIQNIVRASYGKFRVCYEQGLSRDPSLTGKVVVRFVIGRTGEVSNVAIGEGSTLPDQQMATCIVTAFYHLQFPEPAGGFVKVVYPMMFSPG